MTELQQDLASRIEAIESGYEFMLAYAAQGRDTDTSGDQGNGVREFLASVANAVDGITPVVVLLLQTQLDKDLTPYAAMLKALEEDAARTLSSLWLTLAMPAISSRLVDNLNGLVHVRALLTDLFFFDEALLTLYKSSLSTQ